MAHEESKYDASQRDVALRGVALLLKAIWQARGNSVGGNMAGSGNDDSNGNAYGAYNTGTYGQRTDTPRPAGSGDVLYDLGRVWVQQMNVATAALLDPKRAAEQVRGAIDQAKQVADAVGLPLPTVNTGALASIASTGGHMLFPQVSVGEQTLVLTGTYDTKNNTYVHKFDGAFFLFANAGQAVEVDFELDNFTAKNTINKPMKDDEKQFVASVVEFDKIGSTGAPTADLPFAVQEFEKKKFTLKLDAPSDKLRAVFTGAGPWTVSSRLRVKFAGIQLLVPVRVDVTKAQTPRRGPARE